MGARTYAQVIKGPRLGHIQHDCQRVILRWSVPSDSSDKPKSNDDDLTAVQDTIVACVDVPQDVVSTPDFLRFVGPVDPFVTHYHIIRQSVDEYLVLLKFNSKQAAADFFNQYNGRRFSSMDNHTCQLYFLTHTDLHCFPPIASDFCPVCLDRMDDPTTSLLTIPCHHTFHCHCLSKWGDGSCPVCRYSATHTRKKTDPNALFPSSLLQNTPTSSSDATRCLTCAATENLWICLICGHTACGAGNRPQADTSDQAHHESSSTTSSDGHAYDHYANSHHLYALEIDTQRVWDYAGNGYVHRLLQNVVDGKLVELPGSSSNPGSATSSPLGLNEIGSADENNKLEAMSREYTHLLSTQLDSQRVYYQDTLESFAQQISTLSAHLRSLALEKQDLLRQNEANTLRNAQLRQGLEDITAQHQQDTQALDANRGKLETTRLDVERERQSTTMLLKENQVYQSAIDASQQTFAELSDQVRDLQFFLEARKKVQTNPEMEGGSVSAGRNKQKSKGKKKR